MKYSELPKAYKELADKYKPFWGRVYGSVAFGFDKTDEGRDFWEQCQAAQDESELPALPKEKRIEQLEKRIKELESKLPKTFDDITSANDFKGSDLKIRLGNLREVHGIEVVERNTVGEHKVSEGDEYSELYNGSLRWCKKTKIGCEQFRRSFIARLKRLLNKQDVRIILEGEDVTDDIIRL